MDAKELAELVKRYREADAHSDALYEASEKACAEWEKIEKELSAIIDDDGPFVLDGILYENLGDDVNTEPVKVLTTAPEPIDRRLAELKGEHPATEPARPRWEGHIIGSHEMFAKVTCARNSRYVSTIAYQVAENNRRSDMLVAGLSDDSLDAALYYIIDKCNELLAARGK